MTDYCAGFLFNTIGTRVALIQKQRPDRQRGRWNGIGGHVEVYESVHRAMVREFQEEAGVLATKWKRFAVLAGNTWRVHFFSAFDNSALQSVHTTTDEEVAVFSVDRLDRVATMTNVRWLVHMALSMGQERAQEFTINEVYQPALAVAAA